ncbi:asparagine synthase (glutamine-hydrolyzing) [Salinisphaera orenii]|uniref:asparagine synthase (glutamine-hydrolyzing) n=1 Tax=Salinisphaera orenii TaxID=856731 RepID=UPI000F4A1C08|nr:asparagine synthase (glutamine-hydrolyzing) [Salinisphaera halophila]
MCGLTGLWDARHRLGPERALAAIGDMTPTLACRGPDDEGAHQEAQVGLALGHRRLSILDLSPEGHQPMVSQSGRYVLVYNGEIYNFRDIRDVLVGAGWQFRGHSDTEVLLAAIDHWGLDAALQRANGMFALGLWDRETRQLSLARDRVGIKPLYYGWSGGLFLFGSELKALRAAPGFDAAVNRDALTLYLRHNHIPAPYSIHENVYKLPPGAILTLDQTQAGQAPGAGVDHQQDLVRRFWSARDVVERGAANRFAGTPDEAVDELEALLRDAVGSRMVADVPLGAFLSGGVDSSTVVALMQAQSEQPVRTFSIGFEEGHYEEAPHAKAVAEYLGTRHSELYVSPAEAQQVIPHLPEMYDEPFADFSQIPTYLVSRLARRDVVVSLSGDGGDELFCGYSRYFWSQRVWGRVGGMPSMARRSLERVLRASPRLWGRALGAMLEVMPARFRMRDPADKIALLADIMGMNAPEELYLKLISYWPDPEALVIGGREPQGFVADRSRLPDLDSFVERMMYLDLVGYLPGDILTKVDRASMAVGLEARVPLLDHRVVEFAASLPLELKMRHPEGKWPLREVLYRHVPRRLVERPKQGFDVPLEHWLHGPLREWAESLLSPERLAAEGFLDVDRVRRMWAGFLDGRGVAGKREIWSILMFEAWLERARV